MKQGSHEEGHWISDESNRFRDEGLRRPPEQGHHVSNGLQQMHVDRVAVVGIPLGTTFHPVPYRSDGGE